jgi:Glu-tRNA(Gln) amidotransferase subunit E-like FAD-binding protein
MNIAMSFERVLQGEPVELRAFEKEISVPLFMIDAPMDSQTQTDIENIIVDALMRRKCNPIQMHLRLKKGFNATMNYDELADMPLSNKDIHLARELAIFYVHIANLRARLMHQMRHSYNIEHMQCLKQLQPSLHLQRLQQAHATEMERMKQKQRENHEHFSRMMQSIVSNPDSDSEKMCMNDQLTESGLNDLDQQLHDIMERGCTSNQLRCIKIMEAAIEQQKYDALIDELNALERHTL